VWQTFGKSLEVIALLCGKEATAKLEEADPVKEEVKKVPDRN
jgi:hypothetical protein